MSWLEGVGGLVLVVVVIGCLLVGGVVLGVIPLPFKTFTSQVDSAGKIIDKVNDPDNAIYNYEWFKSQYAKIGAIREQIKNTNDSLADFRATYGGVSTWDYVTKEEYNRQRTVLLGLENQENNLVADYNSRSAMANRNIFKDKLPLYVDRILW
jgi:predicted signal transduction protein with EAL and GGDEF domain